MGKFLTDPDGIPEIIKKYSRFCLWKYEEVDGRQTKVPYNPNTLRRGDSSDKNSFSDIATAMKNSAGFDGLGIGVFANLIGIDIDHCINAEGQLSEMAADIVSICDSYTEISPSGTGLRILGGFKDKLIYDKEKYYIKNSNLGIEIYVSGITKRFLTITGNQIRFNRFNNLSPILPGLLEKYMKRPNIKNKADNNLRMPLQLSDFELINKAKEAGNGRKFSQLWNGDISDYPSGSEADQALCNILAFWCAGDTAQMDRLFRMSSLYRDKWDRKDYRESTLKKAVRDCAEFYSPQKQEEEFPWDDEEPDHKKQTGSGSPAAAGQIIHPTFEYVSRNDGSQVIAQTIMNYAEAIEYDPELAGKIKYNELADSPCIMGSLPWKKEPAYREWKNSDDANLRSFLEKKYHFNKADKVLDALAIVMERNRMNPVIPVLEEFHRKWDGRTGHIRSLLPEYLGAEDSEYTFQVMRLTMLGAINRIYRPGCKFDYEMIIQGTQGIGKSTFLRMLAVEPTWYNDNLNTIEGDRAFEKIRGFWIVEMSELLATKRTKDVEAVKAFITSQADVYRTPWNRLSERHPRRCIFCGTTNDAAFLTDRTGNRRFLPITARKDYVVKSLFDDPDQVRHDFSQAWGEAMELFKSNPDTELILPRDVLADLDAIQEYYTLEDARTGVIIDWLKKHPSVDTICAGMIFKEILENNRLPQRYESNEINQLMKDVKGWALAPGKSHKREVPGYGIQKAYVRMNEGFLSADEAGIGSPFEAKT